MKSAHSDTKHNHGNKYEKVSQACVCVCVDCDVPRFVAAVQSGPSHCWGMRTGRRSEFQLLSGSYSPKQECTGKQVETMMFRCTGCPRATHATHHPPLTHSLYLLSGKEKAASSRHTHAAYEQECKIKVRTHSVAVHPAVKRLQTT